MVSIIQYYTKTIKLHCSVALFLFLFADAHAITAKFEKTVDNKCSPVIVTFKNLSSTEPGTKYLWNFGKGASVYSSKMTLQEIYTETGIYIVTLVVTNGTERDSASTKVEVFKGPEALFTTDAVTGCVPVTVKLTSIAVPGSSGIKNVKWDFRNGTILTGNPVQYTYGGTGDFDILVNVTDSNGCSDILEQHNYFKAVNKPFVDFSASDTFACTPPLNVTFINKSIGNSPLTYKWDFGNGNTSQNINSSSVYNGVDSFDVKLKVTDANGCSDSLTKTDFIKVGKVERGSIYSLVNGKENYAGTVCPGNITFGYQIKNQPDYHWVVDYKDSTYNFYTNEFTMDVDSGTIFFRLYYGSKTLCPDTAIFPIGVDNVKANFTLDKPNGCKYPHKVNLNNISRDARGYSWYADGILISDKKNISHTFDNQLTYSEIYSHIENKNEHNITLYAESQSGFCVDSMSRKVVINLPVARFMPDTVSGCIPLKVTFSDSSKSNAGIKRWVYKIGSDSVVSLNNLPVSDTITKSGSYNVNLIITDNDGCTDTSYIVKIEAGSKLTPDFSASKVSYCYGDTIKLNGSPDSTGPSLKWRYSSPGVFNTGLINSPDTIVIIKPDKNGSKSVKLEVNYRGCISEITKSNFYSVNGPVGNFIKNFTCNNPYNYTFISQVKPATNLTWKIDTLTINNKDTATYAFLKSGVYNIELSAEDLASGCKLIKNSKISVRDVKADFTVDPFYCMGDTTRLNAASSSDYISRCFYEGFLWDFADNTPPRRTYNSVFSHVYTNDTIFRPLLMVTADNGCIDTVSKITQILHPEPAFTIDKDSGCGPSLEVLFTNTSTDKTIQNWIWLFGDGELDTTSTDNVNHTYRAKSQVFNSVLRVIDFYGCYTDLSKAIAITTPDAEFQALDNAICLGDNVIFQKAEKNPDTYNWTFGDNTGSSTDNSHLYDKVGTYDVNLTITKNGCSNSLLRENYISVERADASYEVNDSVFDCYPQEVVFTQNDQSSYAQWIWTFRNETPPVNGGPTANFTYTRPGKYNTSLFVRSLNGCFDTKSKLISITGPIGYFTFNPKNICYGDSVVFHLDSLRDVDSYSWFYNDGETGEADDTVHFYFARGNLTPVISIQNKNCSTSVDAGTLYITRLQAAFDFKNKDSVLCQSSPLVTINKSSYNNTSTWTLNDTVISNERFLNYIVNTPGRFRLRLEVGDNNNCFDTISKPLIIIGKPTFSISGNTVICRDIDTVLLTIQPEKSWSVNWSPANGLDNPASFNVFASPDTTTTYVALVTDTSGCSGFDTIRIAVNQPYSLVTFPKEDTAINIGEPANLTVISDKEKVSYWWSPDYKISCRTCSNPIVVPYTDYTYTVKVKDDCFEREKSFKIKVLKNFYLEAPNAFSPNNDGHNDIFYFEYENIKLFNLKIFNRWGSIVYESTDIQKGWDGSYNGKKQNTDTYSYIVEAETVSGFKFEKKGTVILLK